MKEVISKNWRDPLLFEHPNSQRVICGDWIEFCNVEIETELAVQLLNVAKCKDPSPVDEQGSPSFLQIEILFSNKNNKFKIKISKNNKACKKELQ